MRTTATNLAEELLAVMALRLYSDAEPEASI
jgi:hypothetical protein